MSVDFSGIVKQAMGTMVSIVCETCGQKFVELTLEDNTVDIRGRPTPWFKEVCRHWMENRSHRIVVYSSVMPGFPIKEISGDLNAEAFGKSEEELASQFNLFMGS